jgi:ABC-2 type transport system permease protein
MPELMAIVGMNPASAELVSFLEAYLYGFIMLVFPMLFCILSTNKLIARHVDRGSMTYLLAAPVKRETVAFTQMKVMATGMFALVFYATLYWESLIAKFPFPASLTSEVYSAQCRGAVPAAFYRRYLFLVLLYFQ